MISHKHKLIFIHIPKCAGSSIRDFYFDTPNLDWRKPNYDLLYGWCPKRQIHLQHATSKQLLETDLISQDDWKNYLKFTIVRNPWDRAYSSYLWVMNDRKIKDSFTNFILGKGLFSKVLRDDNNIYNRACHKWKQTEFFSTSGSDKIDFVGRYEGLNNDLAYINKTLGIDKKFEHHSNKSANRREHYSLAYRKKNRQLIGKQYKEDIETFNYSFEDKRGKFKKLRNIFSDLYV